MKNIYLEYRNGVQLKLDLQNGFYTIKNYKTHYIYIKDDILDAVNLFEKEFTKNKI